MRHRQLWPASLLVIGALAAACGRGQGTGQTNNSASPAVIGKATSGGKTVVLKTEKTQLGTVLANAQGRTVYWFAADKPNASLCSGACLRAWPAVIGMPKAAPGATIPGTLGEIKRSDGIVQATWNGHPLYTYFGDTSSGSTSGNRIDGYGGLWYAVVLPKPGKPSPTPTSGGGY